MIASVHPLVLAAVVSDGPGTASAADWEEAAQSASAHGVVAWLRAYARRRPDAPAVALERLDALCAAETARSLLLQAELASILRAFESRRIRCAPLRGVALSERLYGDGAARPASDIDLLVEKRDLERVETALGALGFAQVDRRRGFAREFSYTLELVKDAHGGVIVEPHWTLAYPPFVEALDMERVWARCRPGRVAGADTLLLAPDAVLLNLCLHLVHKAPDVPLLWSLDIDRLVRRAADTLDWSELLALARGARVEGQVSAALRRAATVFATPVPPGVFDALGAAGPAALDPLLAPDASVDGRESLALFFALGGVRRRARYLAGLLFPSPRFMALEYGLTHRRELGLAYARRVRHFAWEGLKGTTRLLF